MPLLAQQPYLITPEIANLFIKVLLYFTIGVFTLWVCVRLYIHITLPRFFGDRDMANCIAKFVKSQSSDTRALFVAQMERLAFRDNLTRRYLGAYKGKAKYPFFLFLACEDRDKVLLIERVLAGGTVRGDCKALEAYVQDRRVL
jgi:hypothetical protein